MSRNAMNIEIWFITYSIIGRITGGEGGQQHTQQLQLCRQAPELLHAPLRPRLPPVWPQEDIDSITPSCQFKVL